MKKQNILHEIHSKTFYIKFERKKYYFEFQKIKLKSNMNTKDTHSSFKGEVYVPPTDTGVDKTVGMAKLLQANSCPTHRGQASVSTFPI